MIPPDSLNLFSELVFALSALLFLRTLVCATLSFMHYLALPHARPVATDDDLPLISIIVPCYNEAPTIDNCVASLLALDYPRFEIILVDDGSTDDTALRLDALAKTHPQIRAYQKRNGGKADALNYGIARAEGRIVVTVDADSILDRHALRHLSGWFADANVGAVAGNVKVANRDGLLGQFQSAEYLLGLNLYRRAFATLSSVQVISGAIGAFRKEALAQIGGYSSDTLVEDMDVTIALSRAGYAVIYDSEAIAYTEAPESLNALARQRYRWTLGAFQALEKHQDLFFRKGSGTLGFVGLPYFALAPWFNIFLSAYVIGTCALLLLAGQGMALLAIYATYALTEFLLLTLAVLFEREDMRILPIVFFEVLWYPHFLTFVTLQALIAHATRKAASWDKLERLGKNVVAA